MARREITAGKVDGDDRAVRWLTPVEHLPSGVVVRAPGTLGPLLDYGVLTEIVVDDAGIVTRLAEPHSWTEHGPRIRDAVRIAADLDGWEV
ncbi:MAG: hypothetical protein GX596_13350 [Propionibacterium sp.]|nr:hypothetical protein [Propionibacterium sp.]